MKRSAVWCVAAGVVALLACGSNNGTGSGSFPFSGPSCTSIPTGCWDCVEQNCNGGCITTACADYFSCYCACAMGDQNCYAGCAPKLMNQACEQCYAGVSTQSCQQSCSSQCSVSGGSSSGSSGFGSSSGIGSSSSGSGRGAGCLSSDGSICYTYNVSGFTCPAMTTTVGSCATSNDLGSCAITAMGSNGAMVTATEYYYCAGAFANTGSASTFQSACTSAMGMWTAGSVIQCAGTGSSGGSSSSGGSGSSGGSSSGSSGSSSGGPPTDGGAPTCSSVPCGTMGQMETFCESIIGTTCTAAWYTVGSQTFDCNSCTDCTTASQEASKACP